MMIGNEILLTWSCNDNMIPVPTTSWCSDCDWCSIDRWRNATTIILKWWHDYCCKDLDVLYYTYFAACYLYHCCYHDHDQWMKWWSDVEWVVDMNTEAQDEGDGMAMQAAVRYDASVMKCRCNYLMLCVVMTVANIWWWHYCKFYSNDQDGGSNAATTI